MFESGPAPVCTLGAHTYSVVTGSLHFSVLVLSIVQVLSTFDRRFPLTFIQQTIISITVTKELQCQRNSLQNLIAGLLRRHPFCASVWIRTLDR